jgi:hypothetical protein
MTFVAAAPNNDENEEGSRATLTGTVAVDAPPVPAALVTFPPTDDRFMLWVALPPPPHPVMARSAKNMIARLLRMRFLSIT